MILVPLAILLTSFLLFLLAVVKKETRFCELNDYPFISILVAARDEEDNISECLESLVLQNYPIEKIEILIGDDDSDDNTSSLVQEYVAKFHFVKYFFISHNVGLAKGKANVLAQLARKAKGSFFLITDADIRVTKNWCKNMVELAIHKKCDILTGVTTIFPNNLLSLFQKIDWIYSLALIKSITDLNLPLTAMGNNMLISKKAYNATGGYENIQFSVTEDLALFKSVVANQGKYYNHYSHETLVFSKPIETFLALLKQRKRWMKGAFQTPVYMVILLVLQAIFYPVFIFSMILQPNEFILATALIKSIVQIVFIYFFASRINQKINFWTLLFYEFYSAILSLVLLIYYFIPTGINWKGRKY